MSSYTSRSLSRSVRTIIHVRGFTTTAAAAAVASKSGITKGLVRNGTSAIVCHGIGSILSQQFHDSVPAQFQYHYHYQQTSSMSTAAASNNASSSWSTNGSAAPSAAALSRANLLMGQTPPKRNLVLNNTTNNNTNGHAGAAASQQTTATVPPKRNLINGQSTSSTATSPLRINGHGPPNGAAPVNGLNGHEHASTNGLNGHDKTNGLNGHTSTNGLNGVNGHNKINGLNGHANNNHKTPASALHLAPRYESDLIVVLDMDECLIHSKFLSSKAASQWAYQVQRNNSDNNNTNDNTNDPDAFVDSFCITLPDGDVVHVNKRPYLQEFLEAVTSKYETHVFTAAMPVYASPVLDALDPTGTMFTQRWYRHDCTFCTDVGAYIKDLNRLPTTNNNCNGAAPQDDDESSTSTSTASLSTSSLSWSSDQTNNTTTGKGLPLSKKRVVLVDNNPLSFLANPRNGILVSNFYDDPNDTTLEAVLELLHELNEMEDVRPTLDERFGLQEALASITSSESGNRGTGGGWQ
mmetsp:Transcript_24392/g.34370  ORF Transcript_24392/g.34370 Transcript_24392/m.34370 type:complete len:522 (-) Transcript_24392:107-1672(-)